MSKLSHALALTAGVAIGIMALACVSAWRYFNTCYNVDTNGGFKCSHCKSHTDYKPKEPFRFCPICGTFVIRGEKL